MVAALGLIVSLLLAPAKTVDVVVVTVSKGAVSVPLQPSGRAEFKRDATVTRIVVEVDKLPPLSTFGPAMNTYVVWVVSPEGYIENLGELSWDKDKGRLEATTRFDQVGVFITAEPHYMVDRPSSAIVYRSQAPKGDLRRQNVSVEVGTYDYSAVTPEAKTPAALTILAEARVSLQIAKDAQAERLAENEFRRARAALDTTEQLASRASPYDIVAESANEAIRRSQRAVTIAREKSAKP